MTLFKQSPVALLFIIMTCAFPNLAAAGALIPLQPLVECKEILKSTLSQPQISDTASTNIYSTQLPGLQAKARIEAIKKAIAPRFTSDDMATRELNKPARAPVGPFKPVDLLKSRGSKVGDLFVDATGEIFHFKKDGRIPELNTGAEVISARIYRHFGFLAPETYIVELDGARYSASRLLPDGVDTTLIHDMPNTPRFRMLRIVAAFLKDSNRIQKPARNRAFSDGSIGFYGFDSTLGAASFADPKSDEPVNSAIGDFKTPDVFKIYGKKPIMTGEQWRGDHPMKVLFDSFRIDNLPKDHPWSQLSSEDAKIAREIFRTLDRATISEIVEHASFSKTRDKREMIESLWVRRNAFLEYLVHYLNPKGVIESNSYWAQFLSEAPLSFQVFENRSSKIGEDISKFVQTLKVPSEQLILFRGQETLTNQVLSPMARKSLQYGQPLLNQAEVEGAFQDLLADAKMGMNWWREESGKISGLFGKDSSGESMWWDLANPLDNLIHYHSKYDGHSFFVSATRDLSVASLWLETGRWQPKYRFVYILSVPEEKTVPVTRSLLMKHGTLRESEVAIKYDATPYVIAIYDTVELKFVRVKKESN